MGRFRFAALIRVLAIAGASAAALIPQQENPVFKLDVKLVRLLATVKGPDGQLVGGLNKEDFSITDSGVRQQVAVFERHTEQPLSIVLMLDTSGSTAKDLKYETDSGARFLKALVREGNPNDALSLYSFNHDVTLQAGFTRNPQRVQKALQALKAEAGTSLYDAILLGSEALEKREGRKVIVVVTDGGDTTSYTSFHHALQAAHKADAIIYSIVVVPITNSAGRNVGGENALVTMGRSTGGRAFFPTVGPALDAAFEEILRDLRTQYLIGYYPRGLPPPPANKFRLIKLGLARPDLQAFTRGGYYGD